MKTYFCQCGSRLFFENTDCLSCGRAVGFDPERLELLGLNAQPDGSLVSWSGALFSRCANHVEYGNCNWLSRADGERCLSCSLNDVIPALGKRGNLKLWTRVEQAKRRLLYSVLSQRLPLIRSGGTGMRFRILEDRRRNPNVFESFVATAHLDGAITINIAEADDATRHAVREQMSERYRTVLGHLRHESGHFYFSFLTAETAVLDECRGLFGDEQSDYQAALQAHYDRGPPADWHRNFVSAYAASHPAEDFAETFAHFLHIQDALETARAAGLAAQEGAAEDDWLEEWIRLAITLNEIGRSLGSDDAYPFVLTEPVKEKLALMNRLVRRQAARTAG